jgi:hypothetical protein
MITDQENLNVKFLASTSGLNPRESAFIRGKPLLFSAPPRLRGEIFLLI